MAMLAQVPAGTGGCSCCVFVGFCPIVTISLIDPSLLATGDVPR